MGTFVPSLSVLAAHADLGLSSGVGRCQEYTTWQTRGQIHCSPFCASALSMWLSQGGYKFDPSEHVWGDRGDWNVTAFRVWAQKKGLWRPNTAHARPGWGVVMKFTMLDQHIGMAVAHAAAGQPVVTIEGNTSGGRVLSKTRQLAHVQGFIAFDESGQLAQPAKPKPPEEEIEMFIAATVGKPTWLVTGGKNIKLEKPDPYIAAGLKVIRVTGAENDQIAANRA